jgi:excinuclease ABC subunit C
MQEILERRFKRALAASDESAGAWAVLPDLVIIDGGKGQLAAAVMVFQAMHIINIPLIGLAKQFEEIYRPGQADPITLPRDSQALYLVQRIRDEAHRFAVTFHRKARTMRDLRSELDDIPGVGPRRRKTLLTRFGSVAGVRRATREELTSVVGAKAAAEILAHFSHR